MYFLADSITRCIRSEFKRASRQAMSDERLLVEIRAIHPEARQVYG
jgi:hypothetical protein